jgi:hypothetical protein
MGLGFELRALCLQSRHSLLKVETKDLFSSRDSQPATILSPKGHSARLGDNYFVVTTGGREGTALIQWVKIVMH